MCKIFNPGRIAEPGQRPFVGGLVFDGITVADRYPPIAQMSGTALKPCIDCGTLVRGASRCASHQLVMNRRIEKARGTRQERGYGAEWMRLRAKALRAQPWCGDCMTEGHPDNPLTGDHIVPLSAGGRNELSNVRILCRRCNSTRGGVRATQ